MKNQKTITEIIWQRRVPDHPGCWLRLNAGGYIQVHYIELLDGQLQMLWGWSEGKKLIRLADEKYRRNLAGFLWWGPIPVPPSDVERFVLPQKQSRERSRPGWKD